MTSILVFLILMDPLLRAAGLILNVSSTTVCQGSNATINFDINLQGGTIGTGSEVWYFGSTLIATNPMGTFTPEPSYSRLSLKSPSEVILANVTTADKGEYSFAFTTITPSVTTATATALLTVNVAPNMACSVTATRIDNTVRCNLNGNSENCGTPKLSADWVNFTGNSDTFECTTHGTFRCCASSNALTNCYSGNFDTFCTVFSCPPGTSGDIANSIRCSLSIGYLVGAIVAYVVVAVELLLLCIVDSN